MVNRFTIMQGGILYFLWDLHSCYGESNHHYKRTFESFGATSHVMVNYKKNTSDVPILGEDVPNDLELFTTHCGYLIHRNEENEIREG